jgi:hypothetical protein
MRAGVAVRAAAFHLAVRAPLFTPHTAPPTLPRAKTPSWQPPHPLNVIAVRPDCAQNLSDSNFRFAQVYDAPPPTLRGRADGEATQGRQGGRREGGRHREEETRGRCRSRRRRGTTPTRHPSSPARDRRPSAAHRRAAFCRTTESIRPTRRVSSLPTPADARRR